MARRYKVIDYSRALIELERKLTKNVEKTLGIRRPKR
jgi:hypothetical protein